jgi:hypothetical protein
MERPLRGGSVDYPNRSDETAHCSLWEQADVARIRYAFGESHSLSHLRAALCRLGFGFETPVFEETIAKACRLWWKTNEPGCGAGRRRRGSGERAELPATIVRNNGTAYHVHGTIHPTGDCPLYGRVRSATQTWFAKEEQCLYEQNLAAKVRLAGAKEIKDIDFILEDVLGVGRRRCPFGQLGGFVHEVARVRMWMEMGSQNRYLAELFREGLPDSVSPVSPWRTEVHKQFERLLSRASHDWTSFLRLRQIFAATNLPQPLQIETHDFILIQMERWQHTLEAPCRQPYRGAYIHYFCGHSPARDKFVADSAARYAEERRLATLHLLIGLGHESAMAYYLREG